MRSTAAPESLLCHGGKPATGSATAEHCCAALQQKKKKGCNGARGAAAGRELLPACCAGTPTTDAHNCPPPATLCIVGHALQRTHL